MKQLILLFFIFSIQMIKGQDYGGIKKFNTSNDFFSDLTYDIKEDREGFVWITTENGIAKYNGNSYKKFTIKNGLPTNDVIYVDIDSKNKKWISGYYNGLYFIENDISYKVKKSEKYSALRYSFEKNDTIYFNNLYFTKTYYYTKNKGLQELEKIANKDSLLIKLIDYNKYKKHYIGYSFSTSFIRFYIINEKKKIVYYLPKDLSYYPNIINGKDVFLKVDNYTGNNNLDKNITNSIFSYSNNKLYPSTIFPNKINQKIQVFHKKNNAYKILFFKENSKCVIIKNNTIDNNLSSKLEKLNLDYENIYSIFIDAKHNFWIQYKNGTLTFIPENFDTFINQSINVISKKEGLFIKKSLLYNDNYYFLTNNNIFCSYNFKTKRFIEIKKYTESNVYGLLKKSDTIIVTATKRFDFYSSSKNSLILSKTKNTVPQKKSIVHKNNIYYLSGTVLLKNNSAFFVGEKNDFRFNSFCFDKKNNLIIANEEKLYRYNFNTKLKEHIYIKNTTAVACYENYVIIGTNTGGLLLLNNRLKKINQALNFHNISELFVDSINHTIYASSDQGIHVFKLINNKLDLIKTVSSKDGLVNGKINDINSTTDYLYITTSNGFSVIKKNNLLKKQLAGIYIENVFNENKFLNIYKTINLNPDQNSLTVITALKTYENTYDFKKYYRLIKDGNTSNWVYFDENTLSFKELKSGNYKLQVAVSLDNRIEIKNIKSFNFNIKPFFWETIWFKSLIFLIILVIIFVIFWFYKTNLTKKYSIKLELATLEIKLLKTQMNPHFIFNILNNIQYSMIMDGIEESNKNMKSFSTFLRRTLEMVNNEVISISDELEYLKSYVEIQNIRISSKINLIINIDSSVDIDKNNIPVMVLQPIVENAIIHGLWTSKIVKNLFITINSDGKYNTISIEDNGVGRNNNKKTVSHDTNHKSYATEVLTKRLGLYSKLNNTKYEMEIFDLLDESKSLNGTRVILTIPKETVVSH